MSSDNISKIAARFTEYDMITSYTDLPKFPEHRIDLLSAFLKNGALEQEIAARDQELYGLAISLMQLGLDTHDMVVADEGTDDKMAMRSNQLKVLAGDYFSSRFYQLLANNGYIDFIQRISRSIGELSRIKMDLYLSIQQLRMTAEDFIKQSALIKMQLFIPFKHMMKQSFTEIWSTMLHEIAHCEVIVEQLQLGDDALRNQHSWAYWFRQKQPVTNVRDVLIDMLEKHVGYIQEQINKVDSEPLATNLSQIRQAFITQLHRSGSKYEVQAQ